MGKGREVIPPPASTGERYMHCSKTSAELDRKVVLGAYNIPQRQQHPSFKIIAIFNTNTNSQASQPQHNHNQQHNDNRHHCNQFELESHLFVGLVLFCSAIRLSKVMKRSQIHTISSVILISSLYIWSTSSSSSVAVRIPGQLTICS